MSQLGDRRIYPIILPPLDTTNPSKRLVCDPSHRADPRSARTPRNARILANPNPVLDIRGLLQQRFIPPKPNPQPIRILRDRSRDRRRSPHRRGPGDRSRDVAHHRPLQTLPRLDPRAGPNHRSLVHRPDLRPTQPCRHGPVLRGLGSHGRFFLRSLTHRARVPGRDHVPFLA